MIIIIFNYKKLLPLTPLEVKPLMQVWLISTLMLVKNQIHVVAQQRTDGMVEGEARETRSLTLIVLLTSNKPFQNLQSIHSQIIAQRSQHLQSTGLLIAL